MPDDNSPLGRLLGMALQGSAPYGTGLIGNPVASRGLAGLLGTESFAQRMRALPQPAPAATAREMLNADFGRGITADDPRAELAMALSTATPRAGIRAYHGSQNAFDQFDNARIGSGTDAGQLGRGHYATTDQAMVESGFPHRYEVNVNLQNPLNISLPNFRTGKYEAIREALDLPRLSNMRQASQIEHAQEVSNALRARGYDGVILDYSPTGYRHQEIMANDAALIEILRRYGIAGLLGSGAGYGLLSPTQEPQNP